MFATLHDDLHAHLDGLLLSHPLVQLEYAWPALYGRLNRLYEHRLAVRAGTLTPDAWDLFYPELDVIDRTDRYLRDVVFQEMSLEERFSPARLEFFGHYWTAPDVLLHTSSSFELVTGFPDDRDISAVMTLAEREVHRTLPDTIPVYRGHHPRLQGGCCWYPDRDVALAWAVGVPGFGSLSSGIIQREHVRAVFTRRGETEFIVFPQRVRDISTKSYLTCIR